jgi:hypothetical protein
MGVLSSKTLIKAHALFIFVLAVYLTKSPEVITDSDVVFLLGETLKIVCTVRLHGDRRHTTPVESY